MREGPGCTILFEIPGAGHRQQGLTPQRTTPLPDPRRGPPPAADQGAAWLLDDPAWADFRVADFHSAPASSPEAWHEEVVATMKSRMGAPLRGHQQRAAGHAPACTPLGTMGHEVSAGLPGAGPRLRDSQVYARRSGPRNTAATWASRYPTPTAARRLLRDVDTYFCKLFDGARHDSGDPSSWGERMIEHYRQNRGDPRTKTLVFSDSLNFPAAIELVRRFAGRCLVSFGIGTNLTNDLGYEPLQIVMKMVRCNGQPVAKVSDSPEKTMCDDPGGLPGLSAPGVRPAA